VIWAYWNLRAYRYDPEFETLITRVYWDGVAAAGNWDIDEDNLQ